MGHYRSELIEDGLIPGDERRHRVKKREPAKKRITSAQLARLRRIAASYSAAKMDCAMVPIKLLVMLLDEREVTL